MEEGTSLFEHHLAHDLTISLEQSEVITCISGSASEAFVGSSIGRIFHFRINGKEQNGQMQPVQMIRLPIKSPITSLDYASALGLLMAIANSTLYEIALETKEIINHKSEVMAISINNNPTNDNPFVLQFAMATIGKKILLTEKKDYQNETIQRLTCPGLVLSLAYNKNSICYSSGGEYFVYDIQRRVAIPLFPFDANILRKPLITVVDQSEYLLAGMDGLCIFVSPSGASTRPPFHIPSPPIRNFLLSQQYIYVCTEGKIYVISINDLRIEQVIEIDGVRTIGNLDGRIFAGSSNGIFIVEPISWESQVDTLLEKGKTIEALKTAEERIKNNYSDQGLLKLNDLRQKIGFERFFDGNFQEAGELFRDGGLDPLELIQLIPELVHDFRPTILHNHSSIKEARNTKEDDVIQFVKDYLLLRKEKEHKKLIETTLLELDILEGKVDKIKHWDNLDLVQLENFLVHHEKHNLRASVIFQMKNNEKAFKIWQDLHEGTLRDSTFNFDIIIQHLQKTDNPKAFVKTLDWLCKVDSIRIKEVLNRYRCICEPIEIMKALEQNKELMLWYLEGLRRNGDFSWDTALAIHYVELIENTRSTADQEAFRKLREMLLKSKTLNRGEIGQRLDASSILVVEKILLDAKMDPERAVHALIEKKELDVAEMVCTEFGHQNPKLGTMLLKEFLANPRREMSTGSIGRLLNKMAGYANPEEIVKQLPPGTTLNEISGFLSRSLSFVEGRRATADMAAFFATIRSLKEGQPLTNPQKPILIHEDSTCAVCKNSVSLTDKLKILSTGYVVHAECMPYPHLCPVTNQIFPEQMFDS